MSLLELLALSEVWAGELLELEVRTSFCFPAVCTRVNIWRTRRFLGAIFNTGEVSGIRGLFRSVLESSTVVFDKKVGSNVGMAFPLDHR